MTVWMARNPRLDLTFEVGRHWDEIVALICFRIADSIVCWLTFLKSFVDSELRTFEILNA
jgi:hypothetical protein